MIADLAFVDPADAFPLKTVCDFYKHPLTYCFEDQCLDELLDEFKKGKSHMSIVQSIRTAEDTDPTYTVVGIVTLEDVIEEILKIEIVDETDVLSEYEQSSVKSNRIIIRSFSYYVGNKAIAKGDAETSPFANYSCVFFFGS